MEQKDNKMNHQPSTASEPDINMIFEMLKEKMPMPDDAVKEAVLNAFTYVLSM